MQENPMPQENLAEEVSSIDIRKIISILLSNWRWFALSIILCLCIAYVYLRYTTPIYRIKATVLVQDAKKGGDLGDAGMLSELGLSGKSNVDNEVEIFKSRTLMERVVTDLQLYTTYYTEGRVKKVERYEDKYFQVSFVPLFEDSIKGVMEFVLKNKGSKGFSLSMETTDRTWEGKWGDTLLLPVGKALFNRTYHPFAKEEEEYLIQVRKPEAVVVSFMNSLNVAATNKLVSTINLTLQYPLQYKGEVILNKLIQVYLQSNVDDNNRIEDRPL